MKYVVPGAGGQLGRELVSRLEARGETVCPLTRKECDLTSTEAVKAILLKTCPDVIVNCAAFTQVDLAESEPEMAYALNQQSVRQLALISQDIKAFFVHVSTDFVFDGLKSSPYTETDRPNPINVYGASKLAGELDVLDTCPQGLILRTSWLYSPFGKNFAKTILRLAKERKDLRVVDDQIGTPTSAEDLAQVILELINQKASGLVHVSNEGVASWYDFAVAILEESRSQGVFLKAQTVTPVPSEDFPTPAQRPPFSVLSTLKLRTYLKSPMPHWRESLRKTLARIIRETS